jgi:hypothetical protein
LGLAHRFFVRLLKSFSPLCRFFSSPLEVLRFCARILQHCVQFSLPGPRPIPSSFIAARLPRSGFVCSALGSVSCSSKSSFFTSSFTACSSDKELVFLDFSSQLKRLGSVNILASGYCQSKIFFSLVFVASRAVGVVLEPLNPRLEFSMVLVGFHGGFLVMHMRCSIKYV